MSKKVLSVVMAVMMLLSCFAIAVSAYTYAPTMTTGEVVISAVADKTTVSPGDVVKISMTIDPGSKTDLGGFGNVILYNSAQLTPVGSTAQTFRTWEGDCGASFANPNAAVNFNFAVSNQLTALTDEEKAYFDKGIMILGSSTSSALRWNPTAGEAYVSFQMTVSENVQPGDEIWVGTHEAAFTRGTSYFAEGTKRMTNDVYNITNSMVKLTVAGAEAAPALTHAGRQVKMTVENDAVVSGSEQLRVVSSISADDWSTYFANTGVEDATTNAITEIGFVAFKGDAAAYNADTAKAVAQGTDAADYSRATTDYIQNTGSDYQFGACVKYETNVYDTTYLAYVKYVDANGADAYAFYDTATTYSVAFATNYTTITNNYIAWLASQAA